MDAATETPRPLPDPDADTSEYWRRLREHELWIPWCDDCGRAFFRPRPFCPRCLDRSTWKRSTGHGVVYAFTVVHRAPIPWFKDKIPYVVALVEVDEGCRILGQITSDESKAPAVGAEVSAEFVDVNDQVTLLHFRLI